MNMKTAVALAFFSAVTFVAADALAAGPVDVKAELGIQSKYVWRGYLKTDGPVIQPSVTAGLKGLSLGIWGNMDLSDETDFDAKKAGEMNEVRFSLGYNRSFVLLDVSAGVIQYTYPNMSSDTATTEIFVNASGSMPAHPSLTLYKDVDENEGLYGEITASQTIPISLLFGLEVSGGIGFATKEYNKYNKFYSGNKDFAITDIKASLGIPFGIGEMVKVRPSVTYTGIINSDISDNLDDKDIDDQNVFFGITTSVSF